MIIIDSYESYFVFINNQNVTSIKCTDEFGVIIKYGLS